VANWVKFTRDDTELEYLRKLKEAIEITLDDESTTSKQKLLSLRAAVSVLTLRIMDLEEDIK
jgi:polyhydroxyalkanoate synthesis regulator phasin